MPPTPFLHDLKLALLRPAGTRSQRVFSKGLESSSSTEVCLVFGVVLISVT